MKFCRFCGRKELDDEAIFCEHCGKPFSSGKPNCCESESHLEKTKQELFAKEQDQKNFAQMNYIKPNYKSTLKKSNTVNPDSHTSTNDIPQTGLMSDEVKTDEAKDTSACQNQLKVNDKHELKQVIADTIKKYGYHCDLNFIDVSSITDMSHLFKFSMFNGNISKWNVSNVKDMTSMFEGSSFNGDISQWDVSNVTDMREMFTDSMFNGDISNWDVSNVKNLNEIFRYSKFHGDISNWQLKNSKCEISALLIQDKDLFTILEQS